MFAKFWTHNAVQNFGKGSFANLLIQVIKIREVHIGSLLILRTLMFMRSTIQIFTLSHSARQYQFLYCNLRMGSHDALL